MRTALKVPVLLSGGTTYVKLIPSLAPALWYRFNEPSGATAVNSGSLGAALNGTYTACTLAQAGKMSASGAVLFDGVNSLLTSPAGVYGNYAAQTYAALVSVSASGEGSSGRLFDIANATTVLRFNGALTSLISIRAAVGTPSITTTTGVAANTWTWLFWQFDNAGDRKVHLFKGVAGAVSEYGYSAQNAATGALTDQSATALAIGNNTGQTRTMAGLYDEFMTWPRILTPTELLQIVKLSGV